MRLKPIKFSGKKFAAFLIAAVFYFIMWLLNAPCIFYKFLSVPCPGCGMTHALTELLNGNIAAAFSYHPMFWSLPFVALLIWQDGHVFCKNIYNKALIGVILAGFLICYILRVVGVLPLAL